MLGSSTEAVPSYIETGTFGDLIEFVGAAAPVVTPLSVGVKNNALGTRP
jgi:hypothetical protein